MRGDTLQAPNHVGEAVMIPWELALFMLLSIVGVSILLMLTRP